VPRPQRSVNSAPRRVCDHLGEDASDLLKHRFGIVNVRRPIRGPVLDSPLALCDAQSFTDADLIASDLVYPHLRGETSSVEYNPNHRWYYFSEMQVDAVVLIRVHHSSQDGRARPSFHTSFDNPLAPGAPPRESIELRALVFFHPGSEQTTERAMAEAGRPVDNGVNVEALLAAREALTEAPEWPSQMASRLPTEEPDVQPLDGRGLLRLEPGTARQKQIHVRCRSSGGLRRGGQGCHAVDRVHRNLCPSDLGAGADQHDGDVGAQHRDGIPGTHGLGRPVVPGDRPRYGGVQRRLRPRLYRSRAASDHDTHRTAISKSRPACRRRRPRGGRSSTGTQIANEIHRTGRPVTLSVGEHIRAPRVYRGKDLQWWMNAAGVLDERYDEVDDIARARRVPSLQLAGCPIARPSTSMRSRELA